MNESIDDGCGNMVVEGGMEHGGKWQAREKNRANGALR
jgi:hypothetical protein